jgi:SPP1 gp7 family putative phage head morphogenesis protein
MSRPFTVERKMKDGTVKSVTLKSKQPTIADLIQQQYSVSESHARMLARDQVAKLNGQLAQEQQRDAGVTEYIWRSMDDSRVRKRHKELDGQRFRWSEPPVVDERTNRREHPAGDYQCRCFAEPIFDIETLSLPMTDGA